MVVIQSSLGWVNVLVKVMLDDDDENDCGDENSVDDNDRDDDDGDYYDNK